jgi:sec-independent protein translocase protein TatC
MRKYRRHVIVGLLILAAIITPTADAFTLMLVAIPMWLLYEVSILVVRSTKRDA